MPDEVLEKYLALLVSRGVSAATRRAVFSDLRLFGRWWEARYARPFDLTCVIDRDIREWKHTRQVIDGVAPATINRCLSTLRSLYTWAVKERLLADDPTAGIEAIASEPHSPRSLPDQAVDALLRATRSIRDFRLRLRDEALLALLIYAGLRVQEACDIQLRDLDLAGSTITIRSGKGGRARRVPLHSEASRILRRYLKEVRCPNGIPQVGSDEEREPLLVGMQITLARRPLQPGIKTRIARQRVADLGRQAALQLREAAKREPDLQRVEQLQAHAQLLEVVSPHMLRHSLARRMLKTGAQLPEVQRVLGHSRLSTTGIYLIPHEDEIRAAIERAGI